MNTLLTIFTPTYNRAEKLGELFNSLIQQNNKNFCWIIVDDGSKDNTKERVGKFRDCADFDIIYYYQKNQGKHVAHNLGVKKSTTDLFFCVDSDDTLIESAVNDIINFWNEKWIGASNICGIIAWKGFSKINKIGSLPDNIDFVVHSSLRDLYDIHGASGDMALIFKTQIIKEYPFPVIDNENFLRESITYNQIDKHYEYAILNKILYIGDYHEDGLSINATKLKLKNPKGAAMFHWDEYENSKTYTSKLRNLIAYVYFSRLANNIADARAKVGFSYFFLWLLSNFGSWRYKSFIKSMKHENNDC